MPTFDSGDISARLTLDRTPFNRALDQAKADAAKFEKRGINVRLGVDRKGFDAALKRAKADAEKFSKARYDAKLGVDAKGIQRDLDKVKAELEKLKRTRTEAPVKAKVDASELTRLRADLTEVTHGVNNAHVGVDDKKARATILGFKAALAGIDQDLTSNLSLRGAAQIEARLARVNAGLDAFGRKRVTATANVRTSGSGGIDSLVRKINGPGGLVSALLAIAPAAVPVGAAVTGVLGAVGASFASAGAGLGAFGIAVAGSVKLIQSDMKSLAALNAKVVTAQNAVALATTSKQRTAAQNRLTLATQKYNAALKALGPAEGAVIKDFNTAKNAFAAWDRAVGLPAISKVAHAGLPLFSAGLKIMTPLVRATAGALVTLENGALRALNGAFGKRFIKFLTGSAQGSIVTFGRALGQIGKGFAGILLAFGPFQGGLSKGLLSLTTKFANWGASLGSSSGFHKFIAYIKANGPQVGKLLATAGQAIVAIVKAAAGFGGSELKNMTTVLAALVRFANQHPAVAKFAVATLALAKAIQVLKLASIGGGIAKTIGAIAGARGAKGIAGTVAGDAVNAGAVGGAARAGSLAARAGSFATAVGGLSVTAVAGLLAAPIVAGIIAGLTSKKRPPLSGPGSTNPNGTPTLPGRVGTAQIDANNGGTFDGPSAQVKAFAKINHISIQQASVDIKNGTTPKPGDRTVSTLAGAKNIPLKVLVSGDALAAQKLLGVEKIVGHIPKNKDIRIGTPGVATVQGELANVILATHGLPTAKRIKVSAPGGNLTTLALLNITRAARGLPPVKNIHINSPGVTGALSNINTLAHRMGLLPKNKSIATSVPGARKAILDMINLDRRAHGLPPLKRIPTSAPGADKAVQALIALARRADLLPKVKHINTSTPGAKDAASQLTHLLQRANVLPKGKKIPTDVPGAEKSILTFINLKRKADGLPPLKKIPTSAPGADHSIQQAITLARKIGLIPPKHSTQISTPGASAAQKAISDLRNQLANFPAHFKTNIDAVGNVSFGGTGVKANKDGGPIPAFAHGGLMSRPGYVRGPGGGRDDLVTYAPKGVPVARVSNTEYVNKASTVSREGVSKFDMLNRGTATIVPRFADGGSVHSDLTIRESTSGLKDIRSKIIAHDAKAAAAAVKNLFSSGLGLGGGGGGGASSWIPVVAQALAMLHQPTSLAPLWARTVIANESGGNALAVNRTDINAQNGTPSVGGNQVIGPTFRAYAGPFAGVGPFIAGVSVNRLANTFAALNYAIHAYGSIANTPGIRSLQSGGGYRPYAEGGPVGMHGGGPVQGVRKGASGDWVKALAIQARQLKGAFHQDRFSGTVSDELNRDWPSHEPHHLPNLAKYDPTVKRLVAFLWGRHGRKTTMDDALGHFNHGRNPMAFLDIMRAYDAGKGYLTEMTGKGKRKHRFVPDSTLNPFKSGLRRYEGLYHHDVQALEHKIDYKPENGVWGAGLDAPVAHVIAHALGKKHSQFAPRPWNPLDAAERALQAAVTSNKNNAEFRKDLDLFSGWKLTDLVQTLTGDDVATALPIARAAARHRAEAVKLNAAYRVADTSLLGGATAPGFARGGRPRAGMAWVGEHGPELVRFKGTEQVHSASASRRMAQNAGIDYKLLAEELGAVLKPLVRRAPVIGTVNTHENAQVELVLRQAAYAAEVGGL